MLFLLLKVTTFSFAHIAWPEQEENKNPTYVCLFPPQMKFNMLTTKRISANTAINPNCRHSSHDKSNRRLLNLHIAAHEGQRFVINVNRGICPFIALKILCTIVKDSSIPEIVTKNMALKCTIHHLFEYWLQEFRVIWTWNGYHTWKAHQINLA